MIVEVTCCLEYRYILTESVIVLIVVVLFIFLSDYVIILFYIDALVYIIGVKKIFCHARKIVQTHLNFIVKLRLRLMEPQILDNLFYYVGNSTLHIKVWL